MTDPTETPPSGDNSEFVELLTEALDAVENGIDPDLTQICAHRPDLIPKLTSALNRLQNLPDLQHAASGHDPMVGERIAGRYMIQTRRGSGGMGVIYQAEDLELGRTVAIKMLWPGIMDEVELGARLAREAEVLASLRHPAIVTLFDRGTTDDGRVYLVMDLLEGCTGSELLGVTPDTDPTSIVSAGTDWVASALGKPPPERNYVRQVVSWIAQTARGLGVVHAAGLVHRDIKPSNLFIQTDGTPVLLDFGLATFGPDQTLAERSSAKGTPAYMAPEQLDSKQAATPATDIYGLSSTLYHFLTFSRPFEGTPTQVLAALARSEPIPASRLRKGLPRDLQAVLEKGMERDPRSRYQTAQAFAEDLEAWLDIRPVSVRPIGPINRLRRKAWRHPAVKTVVAIGAVSILALVLNHGITSWRRANELRFDTLWSQLSSQVMYDPGQELAVLGDPDQDAAVGDDLAELCALAAEPSPSRVLYSCYLLRRDRLEEATAEIQKVADHYQSPFCIEVAARYAALKSVAKISLEDLPDPTTDADRFMLYHHLMRREYKGLVRVRDELRANPSTHPGLAECEMTAAFFLSKRMKSTDRIREHYRIHADSVHAAAQGRTALNARSAGLALAALGRNKEAIELFSTGTQLAPTDFTQWHNLAIAQRYADDYDSAYDSVTEALRLQPHSKSSRLTKLEVLLSRDEFDAAREFIDATEFDGPRGAKLRFRFEGLLTMQQALKIWYADRTGRKVVTEEVLRLTKDALSSLEKAGERYGADVCRCLLDPTPVNFRRLIRHSVRDPLNWRKLNRLISLSPIEIDPKAADDLIGLISEVSQHLALN